MPDQASTYGHTCMGSHAGCHQRIALTCDVAEVPIKKILNFVTLSYASNANKMVQYDELMRPTPECLAEFNLSDPLSKLIGGRGNTWQCEETVLKPLDVPIEALQWLDETVRPTHRDGGIRLNLPTRTTAGALTSADGWIAFPALAGNHQPNRWADIAKVAREFSTMTKDIERPDFIDSRDDSWTNADRFTWGEIDLPGVMDAPFVADLLHKIDAVDASHGVIHGDMTGNVLFHPTEPPALIDLTIYWRPPEYAVAIVAIDAVCFEQAPLSLLSTISSDRQFPQYLLRALIFRAVTDWLNNQLSQTFKSYETAVQEVFRLIPSKEFRPGAPPLIH